LSGLQAMMRPIWGRVLLSTSAQFRSAERCLAGCGRNQGVIAAQRRMLKAIAASSTWPLALTRPT